MLWFQTLKGSWLAPLNNQLLRWKITANHISVLSGSTAALSFLLAVILNQPVVFVIGIWLHFLLDGLDGSLARASGKHGDAMGVAMDLVFDSVGITTLGLYVSYFNLVNKVAAILFIIVYLLVIYISYRLARVDKEYGFVVRPRLFVLLAILFDYLFAWSLTPGVIYISDVLLIIFIIIGFGKIIKA
ncbi:MAG: CDP-alcohol phosphatidyltransferase family protein [Patescibacteria group bacterium]